MRNGRNQRQPHTPITSVATKALAAYGAYKLASWAWSKLSNVNDNDKDNDNDPSESIGIGVTANPNQRHPSSHSRAVSRKRPSQLQKCSRETLCTLSTFLNTLKTTLESHTDFSKQTKLLKQMRSGQNQNGNGNGEGDDSRSHPHPTRTRTRTKQELWDEIKTKSITRMIATAYAHSILMLLLTVQIHLLGGRIFREQLKLNVSDEHTNTSSGESEAEAAAESGEGSQENDETETNRKEGAINIGASHKQVLLQTYEYFFQHGIKSLVKDVQLVVEVNLSDWKVLQGSEDDESGESECVGSITLEQFDDGMQRIRTLLDDGLSLENYMRGLESEPEPESVSVSVSESDLQQNEEVRLILDETLDILESPVFETAKKDVVNATFDVLRKDGYAPLFGPEGTAKEPQPLASIVTKLKKVVQGFYNSPDGSTEDRWTERPMSSYPNIYLYHLNRVNSVKELGDVSFN